MKNINVANNLSVLSRFYLRLHKIVLNVFLSNILLFSTRLNVNNRYYIKVAYKICNAITFVTKNSIFALQ